MLASITPLGERGRRNSFWLTATAFAVAATLAGVLAGLVVGGLGALIEPGGSWRLAALAVTIGLAIAVDRVAVPGPRRQVNERWLDHYRGWVYGAGYGAQLGVGVATIVTTAATYAMFAGVLLAASPGLGALVVGVFGFLRAGPLIAAGRVQTPAQLLALHRRLDEWRAPARRLGTLLDCALLAACVALLATA